MKFRIALLCQLLNGFFVCAYSDCEARYTFDRPSINVAWLAFKFNEKAGVPGKFLKYDARFSESANSHADLLQGLAFEIDSMSVDSGNAERDESLREAFFALMKDRHITGQVKSYEHGQARVLLSLNQVEREIVLQVKISSDSVLKASGEIDILDFGMMDAFHSIHKRCELLHTGADGVSRTWSQVTIDLEAKILTSCLE